MIRESYAVQKGDWVLVHAAAGGTGQWLVRLLKATGARTIATASSDEKLKIAKDLGAEVLIKYDEDISVLVSGRLPKDYRGDRTEDPNVVLGRILQEAKGFNTGLTIGFEPNVAVSRDDSKEDAELVSKRTIIPAPAIAGYRAPDVQVLTPALWESVWLQTLMANQARFHVLVFAGKSAAAKQAFLDMRQAIQGNEHLKQGRVPGTAAQANGDHHTNCSNGVHVNGSSASQARRWPVDFVTILPQKVGNAWFELGMDPLGKVYFEMDNGSAYQRYGVEADSGAVFVVRPDGWIGARLALESKTLVGDIDAYLAGLFHR